MKEQSKADSNTTVALVSARWNPTPDQLRALEEMYEGGIRTPSADQIQQIAAKLRQYGKIEGKNVFYWFQNHKARERQKRRRILDSLSQGKLCDITTLQRKEPGLSKTGFEVAHAKNKATSSNSSTLSEKMIRSNNKRIIWPKGQKFDMKEEQEKNLYQYIEQWDQKVDQMASGFNSRRRNCSTKEAAHKPSLPRGSS
ncbi:hypothetical protein CsSME_00022577 [Camellia sinensis var. sinensis]